MLVADREHRTTGRETGSYALRSDWLRHAERVTADAQLHGTEASIQETYYPTLTCFAVRARERAGLRLRSYEVDGVVRAAFMLWPEHDSGGGFLNGGIVSTLLAATVLRPYCSRHIGEGGSRRLAPFFRS